VGSPTPGIYEELKGWQSLIGSAFGFAALIGGALFNFYLNRRRDARLRHEEMLSVATALYGEILLLREEMARLARTVANVQNRNGEFSLQFTQDHKPHEPTLYPAMASKLGLLTVDLIIAITRFHEDYQKAKEDFPLLAERDTGGTYSPLAVLEPAVNAVDDIRPALRMIEKLAGLKEAAPDPNLGVARAVADFERERFELAMEYAQR
jgi:hypothetical protein